MLTNNEKEKSINDLSWAYSFFHNGISVINQLISVYGIRQKYVIFFRLFYIMRSLIRYLTAEHLRWCRKDRRGSLVAAANRRYELFGQGIQIAGLRDFYCVFFFRNSQAVHLVTEVGSPTKIKHIDPRLHSHRFDLSWKSIPSAMKSLSTFHNKKFKLF